MKSDAMTELDKVKSYYGRLLESIIETPETLMNEAFIRIRFSYRFYRPFKD